MAILEAPVELLDLPDQGSETFKILRYERGELVITTRGAPGSKTVLAIRLHVPPEDKPVGAPYWDVTAGNLIARLLPVLGQLVSSGRRIRVPKHGIAPVARHQVDFL